MLKRKCILIMGVLFLGLPCLRAQSLNIDSILFDGYLRTDLSSWKQYIDTSHWETASLTDKKRIINTEYGYIANEIETDPINAIKHLKRFENHIDEMQAYIPASLCKCYQSSANAYWYLLDNGKLKRGLQSYKLAKAALQTDPNDPMANILYANILFHAPKMLGGDKKEAKRLFLKAETLFRKQNKPYIWNYLSTEMGIAQCLEKTDSKQAAIQKCEEILSEYPDFQFIRDVYLPQLLK